MTKYNSPVAMPTVSADGWDGFGETKVALEMAKAYKRSDFEEISRNYKPEHFTQAEWDLATALDSFSLMGHQNVIDALEKWHDEIEDRRKP